jgi:hypothetical protein
VGRDFRKNTPIAKQGAITLKVQEVLRPTELGQYNLPDTAFNPEVMQNELHLTDTLLYLLEDSVICRRQVILDYVFGDDKIKTGRSPEPSNDQYFIRRMIYISAKNTRPLCFTHPLRAELEINEFTRSHFVKNFADKSIRRLSVPLLTFIDGFGLYRNSYRSLIGIYLIMACLTFRERHRRANVLPLTLGPHGNNFPDIVDALQSLYPLDHGVYMEINGQKCFVCVFILCFLGDMPQQQENAGFKTQRAKLDCRFCFIGANERDNLSYDIVTQGRYYNQAVQMRKEMMALNTVTKQEKYATNWGISQQIPSLQKISPALDLIMTRPGDPAHSEYNGLSKQLHQLLLETILTPAAQILYATELRQFPFPPS